MTYGQPAWAGTIPANGGSATGTSVQFTMPKRASDGEVIFKNWPATLSIVVNSKYSYTQDKFANDQGVIAFTNETYQKHDDIPDTGVSQLTLDINRPNGSG
jgi:hypothetical protein